MIKHLLTPYLRAAGLLGGPAFLGFVIVETVALLREGYGRAILHYVGVYVVSFVLVGALDSLYAAIRGPK